MPQALSVNTRWETATHKGGGAQDTQVQRMRAETHDWRWSSGWTPNPLVTAFNDL